MFAFVTTADVRVPRQPHNPAANNINQHGIAALTNLTISSIARVLCYGDSNALHAASLGSCSAIVIERGGFALIIVKAEKAKGVTFP